MEPTQEREEVMLNINDNCDSLVDAFKLQYKDIKRLREIDNIIDSANHRVSWAARRIWIDEHLSDNAKCFGLIVLGRRIEEKGGEKDA